MKLGLALFVLSIGISLVLLNPKIKGKTLALFMGSSRTVLSQMELENGGQKYKVIKILNPQGLSVELHKLHEDGSMLLDRQQLTDKKDAFYKFDEKKHNLFLKDVNGDQSPEVILPSIDKNMKARLNIFVLDFENEVLQKVTKH